MDKSQRKSMAVRVYGLIWLIFKFLMDLIDISPNLMDVPKI